MPGWGGGDCVWYCNITHTGSTPTPLHDHHRQRHHHLLNHHHHYRYHHHHHPRCSSQSHLTCMGGWCHKKVLVSTKLHRRNPTPPPTAWLSWVTVVRFSMFLSSWSKAYPLLWNMPMCLSFFISFFYIYFIPGMFTHSENLEVTFSYLVHVPI